MESKIGKVKDADPIVFFGDKLIHFDPYKTCFITFNYLHTLTYLFDLFRQTNLKILVDDDPLLPTYIFCIFCHTYIFCKRDVGPLQPMQKKLQPIPELLYLSLHPKDSFPAFSGL